MGGEKIGALSLIPTYCKEMEFVVMKKCSILRQGLKWVISCDFRMEAFMWGLG